MAGNYPDGVHENTRGAPWNEHETVTCAECGRVYYPDTRPNGAPCDDETEPPTTDHGHEHELCKTCEQETDVCDECGEHRLTLSGTEPHTLHGCTSCRTDAPCVACGAPLSVCECDGTIDANALQCGACGARQFVLLGTLRELKHYRCRNCGADHHHQIDKGEK